MLSKHKFKTTKRANTVRPYDLLIDFPKTLKSFARGGEPPFPRRGIARQVSLVVD